MATFPGLDSRFIVDLSLQQPFRDKDTGLPLRNGTLTFYEDCNRTTPKSVYTLSGGPSSYIYTDIGNVVTLNSAGYPTDSIYYFPYDGDPDTTTDIVTLYYVEVKNSSGTNQQPREAIPNFFESATDDTTNLDNFIPNGQFRANLNVGDITDDTECIAFGPWYFTRDSGSASSDNVTFNNLGITDTPEKYPRYECVLQNITPDSGDLTKDIRIRFKDVNKFASTTDKFTFKFSGRSKTGANVSVSAFVVYNFGTGGSPGSKTSLQIIPATDLTPSYTDVQGSFEFGVNDGITLGSNNDDYVEIAIRFPVDGAFTAAITDCVLALGDINLLEYPYITDEQDAAVYLGGSFPYPDEDGNDKFLPIRLGECGLEFDDSDVGKIYSTGYDTNNIADSELLCDGTSYSFTEKHNGVPLSRLGNKLTPASGTTFPIWGTGLDNMSSWNDASGTSYLYANNNTNGATTVSADGSAETKFTFDTAHTGADYGAISYYSGAYPTLVIELVAFGAQNAAPSAGTSGFTVSTTQTGTSLLKNKNNITTVDAATLTVAVSTPAKYFEFSNTTTDYYVWYTVDGAGDDPAPGGTGIEIHLVGTDTDAVVAVKTMTAVNGYQFTSVLMADASTLSGGEFWTYSSTAYDYYIWYTVDGVGTDPTPSGTGVQVDLASSDLAADVVESTLTAMNKTRFGVPDLRGQFLRGVDSGAGVDPDANSRYVLYSMLTPPNGDQIGTCQQSANLSHVHNFQWKDIFFTAGGPTGSDNNDTGNQKDTDASGITESRPINKYVHYVIKI
jgi:hypothetical protein